MNTVALIHAFWKRLLLTLLSLCHTINYMNHVPYLLLYLSKLTNSDINVSIYIILCFVSYDFFQYITRSLTAKLMKIYSQQKYYLISLSILTMISSAFFIITNFYDNIYVYIIYRSLISVFNNIASLIYLPINLLYQRSEVPKMLISFTFIQKISTFIFFFFFMVLYKHFIKFPNFFVFSAVFNFLTFGLYYALFKCYKGYGKIKNYYPQISSVPENNNNFNPKNISIDNQSNYTQKTTDSEKDKDCQTESQSADNTNAPIQNGELFNKQKVFVLANAMGNAPGDVANSQTVREKKLNPFFFFKNINVGGINVSPKEKRLYSFATGAYTAVNVINYFTLFMLIMKSFRINQRKNDQSPIRIPLISLFINFEKNDQFILFLFMFYHLIMVFLFLINNVFTSAALRNSGLRNTIYYCCIGILTIASVMFSIFYYQVNDDFKLNTFIIFLYALIMNQCTLIVQIFYNIKLVIKRMNQNLIKETKNLGAFFGGIIFLVLSVIRIVVIDLFQVITPDKFICYGIFGISIISMAAIDNFI